VNNVFCKLFALSEGYAMKRIIFYCGAHLDNESVRFAGGVYVRNAPEYLDMTNEERIKVLTGVIAELSHELEFVAKQVSGQGTASAGREILQ
jgi:hypothetical protein